MDDELTPEQKFAAEDAETMVPKALSKGRSPEDIVAELIRLDWAPESAWALVTRVANDLERYHQSPESREQLVREARLQLAAGILMTFVGVGVTVFTLIAALYGTLSFFVISIGFTLVGLIFAWRGMTRVRLYSAPLLPFDHEENR